MNDTAITPGEIASLRADMNDMKALMGRMVEAMTKLAIIDERQQAMLDSTKKVVERLDTIDARQHESDLARAAAGDLNPRVKTLEESVRELHIERQKDLARIGTMKWFLHGLWLGVPVVMGAVIWAAKHGMI